MKAIVVSLLVVMGVVIILFASRFGEIISGFGFQLPQPAGSTQPATTHTFVVVDGDFINRCVGVGFLWAALVVGMFWRDKKVSK